MEMNGKVRQVMEKHRSDIVENAFENFEEAATWFLTKRHIVKGQYEAIASVGKVSGRNMLFDNLMVVDTGFNGLIDYLNAHNLNSLAKKICIEAGIADPSPAKQPTSGDTMGESLLHDSLTEDEIMERFNQNRNILRAKLDIDRLPTWMPKNAKLLTFITESRTPMTRETKVNLLLDQINMYDAAKDFAQALHDQQRNLYDRIFR